MYNKIQKILETRNIPIDNRDLFKLTDYGAGPVITYWNTSLLGAVPTQAQINAISDNLANDAFIKYRMELRVRDDKDLITTVGFIESLINPNWATMNVNQKKTAVKARLQEWITFRIWVNNNL